MRGSAIVTLLLRFRFLTFPRLSSRRERGRKAHHVRRYSSGAGRNCRPIQARLWQGVEYVSSVSEILRGLVEIPSASSSSNRPLTEKAKAILEKSGWICREFPWRDANHMEKLNLIATPLEQEVADEVDLAFICHTDTVPFDIKQWPSAMTLIEHDSQLHGCGACDVKGALAGILAAISQTAPEEILRSVALILTADEEIGCLGTDRLIAADIVRPRHVIVCEPTSLRPACAGKGYGLAEVHISGKEAHSAFPGEGSSSIYAAAAFIHEISAANSRLTAPVHPLFDPPHTTFNVGIIHGGRAKNIIPGECRFLVEWRPVPNEDPSTPLEWLRTLAAAMPSSGCSIEIDVRRAESGFETATDAPLVRALSELFGSEPAGISFGSEATRFARIAEEVVVIGPGDMHTAHSDREFVPVAELNAWTDGVRRLLTRRNAF